VTGTIKAQGYRCVVVAVNHRELSDAKTSGESSVIRK
jgi:hypothetical protein